MNGRIRLEADTSPIPSAVRDVVFVSHAYADKDLALLLKQTFQTAFPAAIVFDSSDPTTFQPGSEWVTALLHHLSRAAIVVIIATERSMIRPWVWFEAGAAWGPPPTFITCCIGSMHKGRLPAPFSHYTALSLTDPRDLEALHADVGRRFGEAHQLPAFEELSRRFGEIEEAIVRDRRALEDPLAEERWNWTRSMLDSIDEVGREALRLLMLFENATDYFMLYRLRDRGLAQNHASILPGLLNTTNLIEHARDQGQGSGSGSESYYLQWQIKPEFQPFVRRYFSEQKGDAKV